MRRMTGPGCNPGGEPVFRRSADVRSDTGSVTSAMDSKCASCRTRCDGAACPGTPPGSDLCTWQQELSAIALALQSRIICWQQEWALCPGRQASAGIAAQRATTISISHAPVRPTCTVYREPLRRASAKSSIRDRDLHHTKPARPGLSLDDHSLNGSAAAAQTREPCNESGH